ncbi:MAG: hypothetical protein WD066_00055 [Planctomycetaceae bacterium]
MPLRLTEHLRDWSSHGLAIDRDARMIRNIALAGLASKNGYRYAAEALRNAVALYENKPVFLDHAANARRPFERSTRDLVGSIVAARFADGRIRGDIRVVDTEAGRTFLALAETSAPAVGMSHVVLAEKNADGSVVERIIEVVSVDAVAFPATTASLSEQAADNAECRSSNDESMSKSEGPKRMTEAAPVSDVRASSFLRHSDFDIRHSPLPGPSESLERLDAFLPGHFDRHAGVSAADVRRAGLSSSRLIVEARVADTDAPQLFAVSYDRDGEGNIVLGDDYRLVLLGESSALSVQPTDDLRRERDRLRAERDDLAARLERLESASEEKRRRAEIDRLLESSRLPHYAVTEQFRSQLKAAADETSRRRLVEDRRALIEHATRPTPHSRERANAATPTAEAALIAAIRRR